MPGSLLGVGGVGARPQTTAATPPPLPSFEQLFGGGQSSSGLGVTQVSNPNANVMAHNASQGGHWQTYDPRTGKKLPRNKEHWIDAGTGKKSYGKAGVKAQKQFADANGGQANLYMRSPGVAGTVVGGTGGVAGGTGVTGTAGGVVGGGAAGGGAAGGGSTTSTQISPYLLRQIGRYEDRLSSDTTNRAIDRSNLGIADAAALLGADAKANLAARGILNSGAGAAYTNKRITQPALRQAAGAAADIALGRERDLDNLVLGGTGLMTAPDSIALENQRLALAQQAQATDQAFRAQQANQQNQLSQMQMLFNLYGNMIGQYPGGF